MCELHQPEATDPLGPRMAARCKDGGHEEQPRAQPFGLPQFPQRMDRRCHAAPVAAMRAVRPPGARQGRRACQQQRVAMPPRRRLHLFEKDAPCLGRGRIMAKDDAGARRQSPHRVDQTIAQTLIGHQPDPGPERAKGVVALSHGRPYSARMTNDAKQRLADVRAAIAKAARTAGRDPADIELIAISKTHDADAIRPLIAAGQRRFGENRVQEAQGKWPALIAETPDIELHLVGQLQSNKAEDAVRLFDAIHAVDRASLIDALAKAQAKTGATARYFLQVNIGEEAQKGGCAATDVPALLAHARGAGLDIVGLMAVPPAETEAAPYFALLAKIARDNGLTQLSMGMSSDFEAAIMLGATQVRIGTALFGAR